MKRWPLYIALCWASLSVTFSSPRADDESKEYFVKAAFIYNFVKFVTWPGDAAIDNLTNINICVVGANPFGEAQSVFKEASSARLKLSLVHEPSWKNQNANCHILFISRSEAGSLDQILQAVRSMPVLTVSEVGDFANHGGMIGFISYQNKIKLVINRKAATTAGLKIDAQLLEVAHTVIDK